jgi:hypothetical protein
MPNFNRVKTAVSSSGTSCYHAIGLALNSGLFTQLGTRGGVMAIHNKKAATSVMHTMATKVL